MSKIIPYIDNPVKMHYTEPIETDHEVLVVVCRNKKYFLLEEYMKIFFIALGLIVLFLLFIYPMLVVSSRCSREEEKSERTR